MTESSEGNGYQTDNAQLIFFELNEIERLPEKVRYLLEHLEKAQEIADRGYQTAEKAHIWDARAEEIEEALFQ